MPNRSPLRSKWERVEGMRRQTHKFTEVWPSSSQLKLKAMISPRLTLNNLTEKTKKECQKIHNIRQRVTITIQTSSSRSSSSSSSSSSNYQCLNKQSESIEKKTLNTASKQTIYYVIYNDLHLLVQQIKQTNNALTLYHQSVNYYNYGLPYTIWQAIM